jgi:hypothetical protein
MRSAATADSPEMAPRVLLLLAVLVPLLAACSVGSRSDEAEISSCEKTFSEEAEDLYGQAPDEESRAILHRACGEMVAGGLTSSSDDDAFLEFAQAHPSVAGDLCDISTRGIYAAMTEQIGELMGGYVTREDVLRLGRDGCRYAIVEGYGSLEGGLDLGRLVGAHPDLAVPFCAGLLLQAYDGGTGLAVSKRRFEAAADQVCLVAIQSGVVDYSSGNILTPDVDRARFRALLRRQLA